MDNTNNLSTQDILLILGEQTLQLRLAQQELNDLRLQNAELIAELEKLRNKSNPKK